MHHRSAKRQFITGCLIIFCTYFLPLSHAEGQTFSSVDIRQEMPMPLMDSLSTKELIEKGKNILNTNPDSAVLLGRISLMHSERLGYCEGIANSVKLLGQAYINGGHINSSSLLCRQIILKYSQAGLCKNVLSTAYNILGNIAKIQNNYALAASYYFEALKGVEQTGIENPEGIYNNLATVFIVQGQHSDALLYLDKAEIQARRHKNDYILGYALLNKGIVYNRQQQQARSELYLDSALAIAKVRQLSELQYLALAHLGGLYIEKKMPGQAINYLLSAQNLKGVVNPDYQIFVWTLMGQAYFDQHQDGKAILFLNRALMTAKNNGLNQMPSLALLMQVYKHEGKYAKALEHFEAYKALSDSLMNKEVAQNINKLNVDYQTVQKDKQLAENKLLLSIQKNQLKNQRIWIIGIAACVIILMLCLLILYRTYRYRQQLNTKTLEIRQLRATLKGEEGERSRIARELHDGIIGQLMAIRLSIDILTETGATIDPRNLQEVHRQVKDAEDDLRKATQNLAPSIVEEHGLVTAVERLCERTEKNSGLEITLEVFTDIPRYDTAMELSSFRMIQELIQNILKYAHTVSILVQLSCRDQILHITVEDDGCGMPENFITRGMGLKNIKDRLKMMSGSLHIESSSGKGTTVNIEHSINPI